MNKNWDHASPLNIIYISYLLIQVGPNNTMLLTKPRLSHNKSRNLFGPVTKISNGHFIVVKVCTYSFNKG